MAVLGWILTIGGIGLMVASSALTVRVNRGRRIPLWGWPDPIPAHTVWSQGLGVALVIAAGTLVAREIAPWNLVALALAAPLMLAMLLAHNRAVESAEPKDPAGKTIA